MLIELDTEINATKQECFDLARDIDLHRESMVKAKEKAIAGVTTGKIGYGETVTWRATHFGLPLKMTVKITEFESPDLFVDEVQSGPFAQFRHEHFFKTIDGMTPVTVMTDRLEFHMPGWIFGRVAGELVVRRRLIQLLKIRNAALKERAEQSKTV